LVLVPGEQASADLISITRASVATQHIRSQGAGGLVVQEVASGAIRDNHWVTHTTSGGLPVRVWRFEAAAANDLSFSEDISNAAWTKNASSAGTVTDALPTGVGGTVFTIREDGTTAAHSVSRTVSAQTDSTDQPLSVYLRARGRDWAYLQLVSKAGTTRRVWFNLRAGTVGTQEAGAVGRIVAMANGWYRCTMIASSETGGSTPAVAIASAPADNTASYAGTNTLDAVDVWGAQLVTNGVAETSYIPRTGAGAASRAADVVTVALDQSWIRAADAVTLGAALIAQPNATSFPVWLGNLDGFSDPRAYIAVFAGTRYAEGGYDNGTMQVTAPVASGSVATGDLISVRSSITATGVVRVTQTVNSNVRFDVSSSAPTGGFHPSAWSVAQIALSGVNALTGAQDVLGVYIGRGEDDAPNIAQRITLARQAAR
jgi:hypothetical protein